MNIRFVNDDDSVERFCQFQNFSPRKSVSRRIIRRADKKQFRFFVNCFFNRFRNRAENLSSNCAANFDIVDFRRNFIHSVSRRANQNIVRARFAKNAEQQINRFVAAVADKNFVGFDSIQRGDFFLDFRLQRVWITIVIIAQAANRNCFRSRREKCAPRR